MNDVKSLSHSKWRCKYHIVFAPKYRRQIIYGRIKADVGKILRDLCNSVNDTLRMYKNDDIRMYN
ncbi:transposase, partial [uncultured Veillonella sp.]|uniref:transposase n=1 Tax=uncultured Veillonella sp. TaxID=159268 RepID=UPI00266C4132